MRLWSVIGRWFGAGKRAGQDAEPAAPAAPVAPQAASADEMFERLASADYEPPRRKARTPETR